MSESSIARFKTELEKMQRLMCQQRDVLPADQHTRLMDTQSKTFAQRAAGLKGIEADRVGELTTIVQSGPWNSSQQSRIVLALSQAMIHVGDTDKKPARRDSQELAYFYNWLTADEGKTLLETTDMNIRIATSLQILDRMHATLLKETSKRHVIAVLCSLGAPKTWQVKELRSWYVQFKKKYTPHFKDRKDKLLIVQYPEHPSLLTDDVYEQIHSEGNPAVALEVDLTLITRIEDAVWCRGNAVALRDGDDMIQNYQQTGAQSSNNANMQQMMTMMMSMMSQQCRSPNAPGDVDIEVLQQPKRRAIASPRTGMPVRAPSESGLGGMMAIADATAGAELTNAAGGVQSIEDSLPAQGSTSVPTTPGPKAAVTNRDHTPMGKLSRSVGLTPEQQAERFLATMKKGKKTGDHDEDDDDDDDEDDADAAVKRKPAAKHGSNAAKSKAKAKAKAKAKCKAKAKAKATAKPKATVPGWSMARRFRDYPDGCTKCREVPGCTRSCFYYRGQISD
jgi:hypothetical protein